ncbi:hypothetical protein QVD17_09458 [Tagetes erecta]|uniref:Uncharacterized protein n=1 Tax=Tagetes erecta TaxID=13708 RepID=A0AAD8L4P7_TARER|nr:hypothetical protein QVD17_09458 [Tagetes erecta]
MDPNNPNNFPTADPPSFGAPTNNQNDPINHAYSVNVQSMSFSGRFSGGNMQPPSLGSVRPVVYSNPSAGAYNYASGGQQPPSLNDVGRRGGSQTGSSLTENQFAGSVVPGMSMTAPNFKIYNPNAFQKDN